MGFIKKHNVSSNPQTYLLIWIPEILLSRNILMRKYPTAIHKWYLITHRYLVVLHLHLTLLTPGCPGYSFSVRFSAACSYAAAIAASAKLLSCFSPES